MIQDNRTFRTPLPELLGAFLSAHGKHELAAQAFESTERNQWLRLGDEAIRSAPEYNRTHVCYTIKLHLDSPDNGGPGLAEDFEIKLETNELSGAPLYRAYRISPGKEPEYLGLAHHEIEKIEARIVGMYVARRIVKP